jgi:hypothetical protein
MSDKKIVPKIDYLGIFSNAFKIIFENRFLWWFGFFLVLSVVFDPNYIFQNENIKGVFLSVFFLKKIVSMSFSATMFSIIFFIVLILSLIAKGALMKLTQRVLEKKAISFARGWAEGKKYFWINFRIIFFSSAVFFFCIFILWIPVLTAFYQGTHFVAVALAILAFLISIYLLVLYEFIQTFACFYATLADLNIWLALENGYALFKKNISNSLIMLLAVITLNIFSFLAVIIILMPFIFIFRLLGLVFYPVVYQNSFSIVYFSVIILFALSIFVFYSVFSGALQIAWTLFFYEIATSKKKKQIEESSPETEKQLNDPVTVNSIKTIETDAIFDEKEKYR